MVLRSDGDRWLKCLSQSYRLLFFQSAFVSNILLNSSNLNLRQWYLILNSNDPFWYTVLFISRTAFYNTFQVLLDTLGFIPVALLHPLSRGKMYKRNTGLPTLLPPNYTNITFLTYSCYTHSQRAPTEKTQHSNNLFQYFGEKFVVKGLTSKFKAPYCNHNFLFFYLQWPHNRLFHFEQHVTCFKASAL